MDLELRLRSLWDDLQSSLWYRPTLYILAAIGLALVIPYIDQQTQRNQQTTWQFYVIGSDNARTVLSTIASAMLTVVTLTFSILMVTFTLASQQFSPRILRNFTRDRAPQHVLGLQIGIFLYSLLVLVRVNEVDGVIFVPMLSVLVAIGFSLIGTGAFVYFIDHISRHIRVNYIIADIGEQTVALIHEDEDKAKKISPYPPTLSLPTDQEAAIINAPRAGYIQGIDLERLVELAQEHELVLDLVCITGDFVTIARPLLRVYPGHALTEETSEALLNQFDIGTERTLFDDLLYGIRQLVDIAIKALSPAVNDPTTAMNCLDHLTNILVHAVRCSDHDSSLCDSEGKMRLLARRAAFADMVELAFNQIRHYGCGDVLVDLRMIDALTEIAGLTDDAQRRALLWQHIGMVSRNADRSLVEPHDRHLINACIVHAAQQMECDPTPLLLHQAANSVMATL